jgi:ankyrin repeat protein
VEGYTDAVRLLIELGFDVNAPNEFGDSPLVDIVVVGKIEIAELLLAHGADPNAKSTAYDNALHGAARRGNARLVQLLLSAGARADYVTDIGDTVFDVLPQKLNRRLAVEGVLREHGIVRKPPQSDAE